MSRLDTLPRELREELYRYYLRQRYQDLPKDIRGLYGPYLAPYYVEFSAPITKKSTKPYKIQIGDYVIESKAYRNQLKAFAEGRLTLTQREGDITQLWPETDRLRYRRLHSHRDIAVFPRYVFDILAEKILRYLYPP